MIRNIAIIAVVAFIGFVAFSGTRDATASVKATSAKISARQAAIERAMDGQ
jgi:hypothetical protein